MSFKYCPNCGKKLPKGNNNFCQYCGYKIIDNNQSNTRRAANTTKAHSLVDSDLTE